MTLSHALALFLAAFLAGAINSVAGGGTLVSFPTLLWTGIDSILANATSTVALWPGSLGGMWGFRREIRGSNRWLFLLGVPSLLGGTVGALLLLRTPSQLFRSIVPFLILFATLLFMMQAPISRLLGTQRITGTPSRRWIAGAMLFQLLVSVYGGYFGAGIGILMLAALSMLGIPDLHQMNGLKNLFALCINGVATVCFIASGKVLWPQASIMICASIAGGYLGASAARRLGQKPVRRLVIAWGLLITSVLLFQQLTDGRE